MPSLFKHTDKPAQNVALAMYEAAANSRSSSRNYLGMSQIGHECARYLWLGFRGYKPMPIDGKAIMIFRLGDRVEEEVVHHLKLAGYRVEGQQDGFEDFTGLFRGHCDGIIHGVTSQAHILEIKSANDNSWKAFKEKGVKEKSATYFAQAQCYMGYSGLTRALFVIHNKNNSEIYTERLYFDEEVFLSLRGRAKSIITSNKMPDPVNGFACRWCDQRLNCEGEIMADKVCGTCKWMDFDPNTVRRCLHPNHPFELKQWGVCCPDWQIAT